MDEYIITDDEFVEESYDESYESDDDITLEDVESYLESMRNDITDAMELRDNMIQEEYEYEDLSLEDVESYIESNIDVYNDGVDLYNTMIMESDDNLTDDFEESGDSEKRGFSDTMREAAKRGIGKLDRKIHRKEDNKQHDVYMARWKKLNEANHHDNERVSELLAKRSEIRHNSDIDDDQKKKQISQINQTIEKVFAHQDKRNKLIQQNRDNYSNYLKQRHAKYGTPDMIIKNKKKDGDFKESYELKNTYQEEFDLELDEPLTAYEFFDESYEPDDSPIVPRSNESIEYTQEVTIAELPVVTAAAIALITTGKALINQFTTNKKYGRFPKDMKRVYEIIESKNFEASENKRALKKALKALSKDLKYMIHGFGSRWKITVNEYDEIRKLKRHVDDLYTRGCMLTSNKQLSDKRRVGERIEGFLKQGNKVLEILNKSIYKDSAPDAVNEWMV